MEKEEEREWMFKIVVSEKMLKFIGRVVGIIKRNWRLYCGMFFKFDIKELRRYFFIFVDKRIFWICIEIR